MKYWVLYKDKRSIEPNTECESIVHVTFEHPMDLPNTLRKAVMPDRPGDLIDGIPGQDSSNCQLLNWIKLS